MQTEQAGVTRTNLDLMRAVAVSLVLIDHTLTVVGHQIVHGWDFGWLGVFGVYLFFVHTCLVLMWSLERRPHTLDFYLRRLFRVYPLAVVVILGMVLCHFQDFGEPLTPKILIANLLLVTNLFGTPLILFVLWSLVLELQMYLFLPMLFLFARRERAFWPFLLFWAYSCKVALAYSGQLLPVYSILSNAPFFLPGVIAFLGYKRQKPQWAAWLFPALLLGLGVCFDSAPSVERGWLLTMALGLLLPFFKQVSNRIVTRVSHTLAQYSYGVYLLHPIVLTLIFRKQTPHRLWQGLILEALGVGTCAFLAYHLIERPFIQLGSRLANKMQRRFGADENALTI